MSKQNLKQINKPKTEFILKWELEYKTWNEKLQLSAVKLNDNEFKLVKSSLIHGKLGQF